jgi:hypothetical protein
VSWDDGYPKLEEALQLKEQRREILDRAAREARELTDVECRRVELIMTKRGAG